MTQAYPLAWPAGWPRSTTHKDGYHFHRRIGGERSDWTFAAARDSMIKELRILGATNIIISTNFEVNKYGDPYKTGAVPQDQGIAVYFTFKGRSMVLASDRYVRAEYNFRSIALAVDAMRQLERHGGSAMMDRAFTGFAALPPPSYQRPWHEVLGVPRTASRTEIETAYKDLAFKWHPDRAGPDGAGVMADINLARDQALKEISA